MTKTYALRTGPTIEQEWSVRLPNESSSEFQALFDANPQVGYQGGIYRATREQVQAVKADCEFMLDPLGPDLAQHERRGYVKLLRDCCNILECAPPLLLPKANRGS